MNDYKKGDYVLYWDPQFIFGDNIVFRGTTGSDKLRINDSYNTVYAGAGNDVVTICNADNALVYGDAGNDFIGTNAFSRNPTIYGGKGNDTIRFTVSRTYADGGENDDLFIPLNSTANSTMIGGAGNDTFWFIESSTVTASGGTGNNLYRFDPYYLFGPYHNEVVITDLSSNDTIRHEESASDGTELSISEKNGNIILKDDDYGMFTITLTGGASRKSDIAKVHYQAKNWSGTLQDLFPDFFKGGSSSGGGGGNDVIFNKANTAATITAYYEEETFDAADYSKLVTIDASEAEIDLEILGNAKSNKIFGSENNDTLYGGKGTDTLTGNGGADTFYIVKGEGNKVIADYSEGEDIIYVEGADVSTVIKSATVSKGDVIFKVGTNKITVKEGDGQEILFVDEDGTEYTYPSGGDEVIFNSASTSATITAYYEEETFDAADYSKLVTIDASEAEIDLEILGNAKSNKIYGGNGDDTLYGGKGTDTLTGNGGADTFHIVKGEGNKVIADYTEGEDIIYVEGADVSTVIKSATVSKGDVIFKVGTNKITVKEGDGQEILFVDEDGTEYTYPSGGDEVIFNSASTSATITAYYEEETFDAADYSKLVTIDGSEAEIDLEILGNAKSNKIYGGNGDDTLYGGKGTDTLTGNGGADTFHIVKGEGNKVIADYTEGEDIIYVEGADVSTVIKSATVSKSDVIFKVGTNKITVKEGDGQEILFVDEDGTEYTYPSGGDEVIFNSASTSATITAYYEEETFDASDYSKLVTIDASEAEIDIEILGNAKSNKIFGSENNDTLYGGKGTDTLTGNGGADTFHIVKGEGNKVIADYSEGEDIIYVEGADVSTVIKSATVSKSDVIFKVGTNKITVKNAKGSEVAFADEDGAEYTYGGAVSGSSKLWFTADDNNFISDTPQLDAISATKYSVAEFESTSLEIFAQDKQDTPIVASAK